MRGETIAKKKPRRYSDDFRANALAALAANGGDANATAKQLEIPRTTLRQWARGARHPEATQMSQEKRAPLADTFEDIAYRLLNGVTDEKIKSAEVSRLLTAAGISVDKMRLLRGQPTSISDHTGRFADMNDSDLDAYITESEQREGDRALGAKAKAGADKPV